MSLAKSDNLNNALLAISQSLADRSQLALTLDAILAAARQLTFADHGIIYVLDQTGQALLPSVVHHNEHILAEHPWQPLTLESIDETDPFSFAIQNGEVVLINDLYQYNGYQCDEIYQNESILNCQSKNLLAWPLIDNEKNTVGLLVLFDLNVINDEASLTCFCQMAATNIRQAVWLEKYGYMIKELSEDNASLTRENNQLKQRKQSQYSGPIAESEVMLNALARLDKVLSLPVDVLIRGETGVGKEVIAKYIHENSNRSKQALIVQNCAAIPEQLLESELFGHKKGAFTGADKDKIGLFEAADGGTLFLDEIGDMPLLLQAKLLRVLQERKFRPIGGNKEISVDVRVLAATHANLMEKIKKNEFRADLFYRLNVFPITIPPLRERTEDIIPLSEHFIKLVSASMNIEPPVLNQQVRKQLLEYSYPGNVRELKNIVERAVFLSDFETIASIEFGENEVIQNKEIKIQPEIEPIINENHLPEMASLKNIVGNYEKNVLIDCLNACNWQTKRVAEHLALPLSTLNHKMKKHNISSEQIL
ncbi:GAF domain-containing protein [Aliivibrio fischeri]|uniref:sigma-54-dependent Fis family transcriptional regulator n=1 Tax=Aliivibrio fischeri TaxID=668 RepID=UPI0012D9E922|nr:sigma-54-dependent Fis family transcriptional regulator [Aliivibrio fischeri]MUJ22068.1 GAF domain-containing protein [Aliivibrio fischeri]MUK28861.1 GAF domain-containing protein [Aliivibrio fischeri]MUK64479.1 GAF domain-containing protein [Aliivibrio fischeri]